MKKTSYMPKSYKKTSKYEVYFHLCVPAVFEAQKKHMDCELSYLPQDLCSSTWDLVPAVCAQKGHQADMALKHHLMRQNY